MAKNAKKNQRFYSTVVDAQETKCEPVLAPKVILVDIFP